jgi:hypothetical protein
MKGQVILQLNDDDSLMLMASIPIDEDRAKLYHYGYDFSDMGAALVNVGEKIALIKDRYVEPTKKSNIAKI